MFVTPKKIISPISGQTVVPKKVERIIGNNRIVEAHYYDPASGAFLQKGVVSVTDIKTGKVSTRIEDFENI